MVRVTGDRCLLAKRWNDGIAPNQHSAARVWEACGSPSVDASRFGLK